PAFSWCSDAPVIPSSRSAAPRSVKAKGWKYNGRGKPRPCVALTASALLPRRPRQARTGAQENLALLRALPPGLRGAVGVGAPGCRARGGRRGGRRPHRRVAPHLGLRLRLGELGAGGRLRRVGRDLPRITTTAARGDRQ